MSEATSATRETRAREHTADIGMLWLETAASSRDAHSFAIAVEAIDWQVRPADETARAVDLALKVGAPTLARTLAMEGADRFPDHPELRKMAYVLAPPKARIVPGQPDTSWKANRAWLLAHRHEYAGQWIALLDGVLLGADASFDKLVARIGDVRGTGIFLTIV